MSSNADKLILVDTNCLIRIYFSALRPVMGQRASGYVLKTLKTLAEELKSVGLRKPHYSWLHQVDIQGDVEFGVLVLTRAQETSIAREASELLKHGNSILTNHCRNQSINSRRLSFADAKALAAALEFQVGLATDDWPLRHVAGFYSPHDNGEPFELFCSIELVALLEKEGLIAREDRMQIYADWLKFGESLFAESASLYYKLFNERPPSAQYSRPQRKCE